YSELARYDRSPAAGSNTHGRTCVERCLASRAIERGSALQSVPDLQFVALLELRRWPDPPKRIPHCHWRQRDLSSTGQPTLLNHGGGRLSSRSAKAAGSGSLSINPSCVLRSIPKGHGERYHDEFSYALPDGQWPASLLVALLPRLAARPDRFP